MALIDGLLSYHLVKNCLNPHCYTKVKCVYDPKVGKDCSLTELEKDRTSFLKFHLKCTF